MYPTVPKWDKGISVTASTSSGYRAAVKGANQPQQAADKQVTGNETFSASSQNARASETSDSAQAVALSQHVQKQESNTKQKSYDSDINHKIWKVAGNKKFIDFNSQLVMAYISDYANVHGRGGSGHAGNSTIGVVICDYKNGTGEGKSITVKYNLDVEDVDFLYEAAMAARLNQLKPDPSINATWIEQAQRIIDGWKVIPKNPDGSRAIPSEALNALNNTLNNARTANSTQMGTPYFSYFREKNNPYAKTELAPCSKVRINYTPYDKNGAPSGYPWYISIENFEAPLIIDKKGASSHNSKEAVNKTSAFINMTCEDFCNAMTAVQRFVKLWEHRAMPIMEEAYRRIDCARNKTNN